KLELRALASELLISRIQNKFQKIITNIQRASSLNLREEGFIKIPTFFTELLNYSDSRISPFSLTHPQYQRRILPSKP
uniref:Uncharacterized protein n=1 Tax=Megaselia scalaris TaxID=36166 RepID=T1GCL3_MEGSC